MPASADRARFERCFRAHYPDVLAFSIRRCPDRALAEDVAAETFAVAWRRREQVPQPPLPWLYAVALRVIANQRRSYERRHRLEGRIADEARTGMAERDPVEAIGRRDAFQ